MVIKKKEQLRKKNSRGTYVSYCHDCFEGSEKLTQASYGYVDEKTGKGVRLYCAKHGKKNNMISLKTDGRSKYTNDSGKDTNPEDYFKIFDQSEFILEKTLHSSTFTKNVSVDDELTFEITKCELKPRRDTPKNGKYRIKYWDFENLRQKTQGFNSELEADEFMKLKQEELDNSETLQIKLTIQYLIDNGLEYYLRLLRIPLDDPIQFDDVDVEVEPYFLGIWLGDGDTLKQTITSDDEEVGDYLRGYAKRTGMKVSVTRGHRDTDCNRYTIVSSTKKNPLLDKLRDMNLINNKHIPENYFNNSIQKRRELLAGLLDSDGTKQSNQTYTFAQYVGRKELINDVAKLADELGYLTRIEERDTICTNAKGGPKKFASLRLHITGDFSEVPFRIKRKKFDSSVKSRNTTLFTWRLLDLNKKQLPNCPIRNQTIVGLNERLEELVKFYDDKKTFPKAKSALGQSYTGIKKKCGAKPTIDQIKESECKILRLIKMIKYP